MRIIARILCVVRSGIAVLLFGIFFAPTLSAQSTDKPLREIRVEGAQRIEAGTVRSYMGIKPGDSISPGTLDRSLKSLFATGLFADVTIRRDGPDVVVRIIENPIINRLVFEGNRRIEDEILRDEVKLRPRVVFTRARVQTDLQRISDIYRRSGRFSAVVVPKVIQLPQNRVDLVFEIKEGELSEIRKISFVGNKEFDDGDLREIVQTKESAWYRFFSSDDTYDPDRLTFDRELLRRHYLANGYADFRVISTIAELTPDNKAFFVTFTIEEGKRYKFGRVDVRTSLKNVDAETLQAELPISSGTRYNADDVEAAIGLLTDSVGTMGYAFVDIRPRVRRDRNKQIIDVTFDIKEGPRVFVELINISGNVRTLDEVVRREVLLVEGDAFNSSKLRRSRQRIRNLGFFERAGMTNKAGSEIDKTIIDISVREKSTGELAFGAGISSETGVLGDVSLRERNLLGRGQDLRLGVKVGAKQQDIDLSFTEPYFLDRELSAGLDVFRKVLDRKSASSFQRETTGFKLRTGYRITEILSQSINYTLRNDEVTDIPSGASAAVKEQDGSFVTSAIGQSLLYDKRDNRFSPSDGYFVEVGNTLAGFGGDSQYLRNILKSGTFFSFGEDLTLAVTGGGGLIVGIDDDIRIIDRFFLGGSSLRGFEDSGVGPRDLTTQDSVGGNWFYRGTVGLAFPLGLPNEFGFRGQVFTDAGSVGENDSTLASITDTGSIRMSVGTGVQWDSPVGPINITLAYPIFKEDFDQTEIFRFSFGARF
ncbi:MAG: Outer membrane protein assembly factor BamA [Alphaproteobacteria bacterium MarineAlpha11_Bin1]|nr:MAG: Outer membrane protein assembly factor BamA [Alphaproteobacteria bacterium MarineAlpha11_Bin1]|tara:strand:- start:2997 stop:5288 length:2292 start_codon:yes stop_codon:yes gene_type:complete